MAKSIAGRKVRLFRCQIPPMIGPKILNAHVPKDLGWEAEIDSNGMGIVVKTQVGTEHFIPFAIIQTSELYPQEAEEIEMKVKKLKSQAV